MSTYEIQTAKLTGFSNQANFTFSYPVKKCLIGIKGFRAAFTTDPNKTLQDRHDVSNLKVEVASSANGKVVTASTLMAFSGGATADAKACWTDVAVIALTDVDDPNVALVNNCTANPFAGQPTTCQQTVVQGFDLHTPGGGSEQIKRVYVATNSSAVSGTGGICTNDNGSEAATVGLIASVGQNPGFEIQNFGGTATTHTVNFSKGLKAVVPLLTGFDLFFDGQNLQIYAIEASFSAASNAGSNSSVIVYTTGELHGSSDTYQSAQSTVSGSVFGVYAGDTGGSIVQKDTLYPGQCLYTEQYVDSADGSHRLIFQGDGNLVLYNRKADKATWATNTSAAGGFFAFQGDSNLCVYDAGGKCAWASGGAQTAPVSLCVQDDGNLVAYDLFGAYWSSGTAGK